MSYVSYRDNQKYEVCKIAKSMVKTSQDIIAEQYIINDHSVLAVSK